MISQPPMLFTGTTEHSIDSKGRLAIPARYRNQWDALRDGGAWFCVPWPTGHLRLYTEGHFREFGATDGDNSIAPEEDEAGYESALYGFAERLEMDPNGRITIPRTHLEWTGLRTEQAVMVVGARTRLEVHDKGNRAAEARALFEKLPELVARKQQRMRESRDRQPPRS